METVRKIFRWLFSLEAEEMEKTDPTEKLLDSIILTARSRFNAANRLEFYAKIGLGTNVMVSLGLILIPLLQLAKVPIRLPEETINAILIFFAVTVLVYSIITSAAGYEVRIVKLNDCGNELKDLIREIRAKRIDPNFEVNLYNKKYGEIINDSENHSRSDYIMAKLESKNMFVITGLKRLWLNIVGKTEYGPKLFVSALLIVAEAFLLIKAFKV